MKVAKEDLYHGNEEWYPITEAINEQNWEEEGDGKEEEERKEGQNGPEYY